MALELKYNQLKKVCGKKLISFETTKETAEYTGVIGQKKAADALEFGLGIEERGYNVYVSGMPGTGKTTFAAAYAEKLAAGRPTPDDLCYVYNFKEPRYPKRLLLPGGKGREFKEDMEALAGVISDEIPKFFSARDYENRKHAIVKGYQEKRDELIRDITSDAKERDYGVRMTNTGIYFMPIVDDEMISEEQYNELSQEERDAINESTNIIQAKAQEVMHSIREFERATQKEVEELERSIALEILEPHFSKLLSKYEELSGVTGHLELVREDILENLEDFAERENGDSDYLQSIMPWIGRHSASDMTSKYAVNLLTDNSGQNGAPVIVDFNPTYGSLVGEIEYDSEFGNLTTDFMKIKPGLLHKANKGFLVLQARDVLTNTHVWEALRKCLLTRQVVIEPLREYTTGLAMAGLRPEAVDIDVKVILAGSSFYYDILYDYDEEFRKLFRINAVFDYEMPYSDENVKLIAGYIKKISVKHNTAPFDSGAAAMAVEYLSRLAESQDKLSAQFGKLAEILLESNAYAAAEGKKLITAKYIKKAIEEKENRVNLLEEKMSEMINRGLIMIDTDGEKTAQINGLAVLDTGDYSFAKPIRITATTYMGKSGIVNIEKEAEMSGSIHDKGVQVIIGYLGQKYAQDFPLSLSCRICFEQSYSGVDGDSASSAELYAILSSLADVPLRQDIAVTGSMNQRGEIQAIGGVTYKTEGFFSLCKERGLTGKQGVIIPARNVRDLSLSDNVIEAVKKGMFHIYPIDHIDDGISILTGLDAGGKNEGKYPPDSIHGMVLKKLKKYYKKSSGE